GTTTCRSARAARLAQAPPTRDGGVERPARVGRPGSGALPCGVRRGTQPANSYPPLAHPLCPPAGGTGPAIRRGEAADTAPRPNGLAGAGRQPALGARERAQGTAFHLIGARAGRAG